MVTFRIYLLIYIKVLIWGVHPVKEAILNNNRKIKEIFVTSETSCLVHKCGTKIRTLSRKEISAILPQGAVHQGIAADILPLKPVDIKDLHICPGSRFIILDQVIDPHNVGAICRNGAAFGVEAIIMTEKHSPKIDGVLAKSAAGAIEHISIIFITNLARGIEYLQSRDVLCVGLCSSGTVYIDEIDKLQPIAVVMGSEGTGLRRLTKEKCDVVAKIRTCDTFPVMNVSCASAVALSCLRGG